MAALVNLATQLGAIMTNTVTPVFLCAAQFAYGIWSYGETVDASPVPPLQPGPSMPVHSVLEPPSTVTRISLKPDQAAAQVYVDVDRERVHPNKTGVYLVTATLVLLVCGMMFLIYRSIWPNNKPKHQPQTPAADVESKKKLEQTVTDLGSEVTALKQRYLKDMEKAEQATVALRTRERDDLENQRQLALNALDACTKERDDLKLQAQGDQNALTSLNKECEELRQQVERNQDNLAAFTKERNDFESQAQSAQDALAKERSDFALQKQHHEDDSPIEESESHLEELPAGEPLLQPMNAGHSSSPPHTVAQEETVAAEVQVVDTEASEPNLEVHPVDTYKSTPPQHPNAQEKLVATEPLLYKWYCDFCHGTFPGTISGSAHRDECKKWNDKVYSLSGSAIGYPHDWNHALPPYPTEKDVFWMHARSLQQLAPPSSLQPNAAVFVPAGVTVVAVTMEASKNRLDSLLKRGAEGYISRQEVSRQKADKDEKEPPKNARKPTNQKWPNPTSKTNGKMSNGKK
ncbi:hypothetical protein G6514_007350 [Epicoccum nigrum]|nr:hypothetical protein G6514_007350 [Epicoccum nigrum]